MRFFPLRIERADIVSVQGITLMRANIVGPTIGADRYRMATTEIRAIDQDALHAHLAHVAKVHTAALLFQLFADKVAAGGHQGLPISRVFGSGCDKRPRFWLLGSSP